MPAWRLKRFSRPTFFTKVNADLLYAFLAPYRAYWESIGIPFPPTSPVPPAVFESIRLEMMTPKSSFPGELIRALSIVDDLATADEMDALLSDLPLERLGLRSGETTPADYMLAAWQFDPGCVERHAVERRHSDRRSYVVFRARSATTDIHMAPPTKALNSAEETLNAMFRTKNRGVGARIQLVQRDDGIMVMILHGDPLKRAESMREGTLGSVCYRQAKYDFAFVPKDGSELQIAARTTWERELYRSTLGQLLAGDAEAFTSLPKFTLTPLLSADESLLTTGMVPMLTAVELRKVILESQGEPSVRLEISSLDSRAVLAALRHTSVKGQRIVLAEFRFSFEHLGAKHAVVIRPPDRIQCSSDLEQCAIAEWLIQKGFLNDAKSRSARPSPVVANPDRHPDSSRSKKRVET